MIQVIYLHKMYLVPSSTKKIELKFHKILLSTTVRQIEFRFNFFEHDYFDKFLNILIINNLSTLFMLISFDYEVEQLNIHTHTHF